MALAAGATALGYGKYVNQAEKLLAVAAAETVLIEAAAKGYKTVKKYPKKMRKMVKRYSGVKRKRAWMAKSARKYRRTHFGERVGKQGCKRDLTLNTQGDYETRTQYIRQMTEIAQTSINDIRLRQRDIINFRGFKACLEIFNQLDQPLYFIWAVVSKKQDTDTTVTDFFRNMGSADARGRTFSTSLSANEFHCLPINSDKYHVYVHKRMLLGPRSTNANFYDPNRANYRTFNHYEAVRRQVRFTGQSENEFISNLEVVWWCDAFYAPGGTAAYTTGAVKVSERYITYWKEPKN
jgi:hypothetical protein